MHTHTHFPVQLLVTQVGFRCSAAPPLACPRRSPTTHMLLAAPQLEPWGRISTSAVWPGATHGVRKTTGTAQWTSAAAPPPVVATGSCCDPAATVAPSAVLKFSSPIAVFVLALSSRALPPVAQALAFEELQLAGETLRPLAQPLASSSCYRFEIVGTRTPSMKRRVFTFLFCFLCFSHVAFSWRGGRLGYKREPIEETQWRG